MSDCVVRLKTPQPIHGSLCSDAATKRGKNQKVVSFSFYGKVQSHYYTGIKSNLEKIEVLVVVVVVRFISHNEPV